MWSPSWVNLIPRADHAAAAAADDNSWGTSEGRDDMAYRNGE